MSASNYSKSKEGGKRKYQNKRVMVRQKTVQQQENANKDSKPKPEQNGRRKTMGNSRQLQEFSFSHEQLYVRCTRVGS